MAKVQHTVTGCIPIDKAIIEAYVQLINTDKVVNEHEDDRQEAEGQGDYSDATAYPNTRRAKEAVRQQNELERQANEGTSEDERGANTRWGAEKQRQYNESVRQAAEGTPEDEAGADTRWGAEKQRQADELAREHQAGEDHTQYGLDHGASVAATERANNAAAAAEHQVDVKRGYGIASVTEPVVATTNGGVNTIRVTTEDNRTYDFYVRNGKSSEGLFATAADLPANPSVGDYAFVGADFPADIYICATAGVWTDSGNDYDGDSVDLTNYATKDYVSVSQNSETGHTDINIGSDSYPVASVEEVSQLGQKVTDLPEELKSEFPYVSENIGDLSFSDERGNVIAEFYDGHIRTKEFDSKEIQEEVNGKPYAIDNNEEGLLFSDEEGNIVGGWKDGHEIAKYPSSYTKNNEFTDLDIEDENGNRVASFSGGHIKTKNFWSKDLEDKVNDLYQNGAKHKISILFVGNSMTQDAISYLPYVLKQIAPDIIFNFYIYFTGGFTLADQYENFVNEYIPGTFSICENVIRWTNNNSWESGGIHQPMKEWLKEIQFDILCLQDYFSTQPTTDNAVTDFNNCVNYIRDHYDGEFKVVNLFHRPRTNVFDEHGPQSTLECFNMIKTAAEQCMKNTACQSVIVPGVAAYFATLDPILQPLGDIGNLTADGSHAQDTMACLMQAYTAALWVFDELGLPYGIYNKGIRATQAVFAAVNPPGPNVGSGIIVGTDAQNNEAQLIAVKAFKYGQNLVNNSLV